MLVVFAENDAVAGQFDDESQSMMECTPEPNLIVPLNVFDPGSVQSAFATLAAGRRLRQVWREVAPAFIEWSL